MALLPSGDPAVASSLTHASTTAAAQKLNFTALRTFISDLLGVDSADKQAARTALGSAASGANVDITSRGNNTSTVYTSTGTATAYTITPAPAITVYAVGQSFQVNLHLASGAAPTLQINGVALPPNIVRRLQNGAFQNVSALPAGLYRITLLSATQALAESVGSLIVGPVSQTSGVPTGAVIERGSNANGEFVRWADGTQICTRRLDLTIAGPANAITISPVFTFPAVFAGATYVRSYSGYVTEVNGSRFALPLIEDAPSRTDQWAFAFNNNTATPTTVIGAVSLFAIGRWF